jgi:hypothetical protein
MSDDPTTGPPDEPEHPADKILGADWMAPGRRWLEEAWDAHEQHELLAERGSERDAKGDLTWQLGRLHTEDGWFEYWQVPVDREDKREPIRVCAWPAEREEKAEAEARAIVEEHDDFPR